MGSPENSFCRVPRSVDVGTPERAAEFENLFDLERVYLMRRRAWIESHYASEEKKRVALRE